MEHPTDLELSRFLDGALELPARMEIEEHLRWCVICRTLLEDAEPMSCVAQSEPSSFEVPATLFNAIWEMPSDPQIGDIWRVRWNADSEFVLVLRVEGRWVTSAPVVVDPLDEDSRCVRLDADESPIGLETVVWIGLCEEIPMGVFEARFGAISNEAIGRISNAEKRSSIVPAPRTIELRIRLAGIMERLGRVRWNPATLRQDRPDVRAFASEKNVAPSAIAKALQISPAEVTDIFRAHRLLTAEEIEKLSLLLDVATEDLEPLVGLPEGLVCSLERPRYRSAIVRQARAAGSSETEIRIEVAKHVMPMRARSRGPHGAEPEWDDLIDDYLALDA